MKLTIKTFPAGHGPDDFQCFGPPALKDGEFDHCRIADLGCFTQDGKDSNKMYHAAVVQSRKTKQWFAYFEWGRTGAAHPSFQFVACDSEAEAQREFAAQLHSKNDRRGEWVMVAGIRTLRARAGQDCYLVRPMATRSTGLPDAHSIKANDGARPAEKNGAATSGKNGKSAKKPAADCDPQTLKLLRDLAVATVAYTRGSMADASLPTQAAVDEARAILAEAQKRVAKVGDQVDAQVSDNHLMQLTSLMYARIPKRKERRAGPSEWILNKDNILAWQNDLDAFESALYATDIDHEAEVDPFEELQLHMEWVAPKSAVGKFLYEWWPRATANRHAHLGTMHLKNVWRVERHADAGRLPAVQEEVAAQKPATDERPLFQPEKRLDAKGAEAKRCRASNTALLFHGTRSVNVRGILREALRLPKQLVGVVITGAMFGPGLYFADDWKKSAGYTSLTNSYWSGGSGAVGGRDAFMFAVDVVLGNPFVAPHAAGYTAPPDGHHSVFGKAGHSGVQNNEFVVFDPKQHRLRYLAEFTTARG